MFKHYVLALLVINANVLVAGTGESKTVRAKVIHSEPIYESISVSIPEQYCREETVRINDHQHSSRPLIAALIGGALGNELGHNKSNKRVGAVAGAMLGASLASSTDRRRHRGHHYQVVNHCEERYRTEWHDEITGYNVRYRVHGEDYKTRLPYNPGKYIEVNISITPLG